MTRQESVATQADIEKLFEKQAVRSATTAKTYSMGMVYYTLACTVFAILGQLFLMLVMHQQASIAGWGTACFLGLMTASAYMRYQVYGKRGRNGR